MDNFIKTNFFLSFDQFYFIESIENGDNHWEVNPVKIRPDIFLTMLEIEGYSIQETIELLDKNRKLKFIKAKIKFSHVNSDKGPLLIRLCIDPDDETQVSNTSVYECCCVE